MLDFSCRRRESNPYGRNSHGILSPMRLPIPPLRRTEKLRGKFWKILSGRPTPWQALRISRKCRINMQEQPRGRQLEPPPWRTSLCIKDYSSVADLDWHRLLEHPIRGRAMLVDVFLVRQKATLYPRVRQWQRLVASDAAWLSCCGLLLIEILLKAREDLPDLFRPAQIGHGVGDGVVVFEAEQRRQLLLVEFLHAFAHIV